MRGDLRRRAPFETHQPRAAVCRPNPMLRFTTSAAGLVLLIIGIGSALAFAAELLQRAFAP